MVCPTASMNLRMDGILVAKYFASDTHAIDYVRDSWLPLIEDSREVWVVGDKR